jgi:hypothetical protein
MSRLADEIRTHVCDRFADTIGLPVSEFVGSDLSLAAIISRSDRLTNSVDLMEAFARAANSVKKQYGILIRLPAFPLDTPISNVVDAFVVEARKTS